VAVTGRLSEACWEGLYRSWRTIFWAKFGSKITIGRENFVQTRKVTTHVFLNTFEFSVYQLSYRLIII